MKNVTENKGKLNPAKVNKLSEQDMNQVLGGSADIKFSLTISYAAVEEKVDSDKD